MADYRQSSWRGYAISLAATCLALLIARILLEAKTPFLPCVAAVIVIAWLYGRGPGTLSAVIFTGFTSFVLFVPANPNVNANLGADAAREFMFVGVCIVAIAVTSAQRKAQALAHSKNEWLHFTLANISNGVIGADSLGRITFINLIAQRLTGFGPEALGMSCNEVFRIVALDTKKELENPISRALREGATVPFEKAAILISKDGRRYVIEGCTSAFPALPDTPPEAVLVFRDVTEQRRIEGELRSVAERFRLALDAGKLIPWEWNIVSDELIYDDLSTLLPGVTITTRRGYLSYIHPDDREAIVSTAERALFEKKTYIGHYRLVRPDGDVIWVESRGRPFFNERGEAVKMLGVLRDMTEQKLVEKIVRDGQEQFRNVAESALDGFITVDESGKILYANNACAAIFGYLRAELIGLPLSVLIPERLRGKQARGFERYIKGGEKATYWSGMEIAALRKDGSESSVELSLSETRAGQKRLFTAIVRDISQRTRDREALQEARDRLELAQRIAGLGTFVWDLRIGHGTISAELESIFGFKPDEFDGTYESWEKNVHPEDLELVRENARRMLEGERPEYSSEFRIIRADKSIRWLASKTKMFRNKDGQPLWALGAILDITRHKDSEAEREKLLINEQIARERLTLANRIAGIGTYEWNLRDGSVDMSLESGMLYGLERGAVFHSHAEWRVHVHPLDRDATDAYLKARLAEQAVDYQSEYRVIWPDNSIHWLMTKGKISYDETGKPISALGAEQDITRAKEAASEREALLANETAVRVRMELAHGIAGIGTFEWDALTGQTTFSPELERIYGLGPGEFRQTYEHWIQLVHPDDRSRLEENSRRVKASGSDDYAIEFRVPLSDGSTRYITTKGKLFRDETGRLLRLVGVEQDITARKAAEAEREQLLASEKIARERLELAQRAAGIGIYERDMGTNRIHCSPELLLLLDLPPERANLTLEEWVARIHPEDCPKIEQEMAQAAQTASDYYFEYRVRWRDDSVHWLASSGRIVCSGSGEPQLSIGATLDITEHKVIEVQREAIIEREKAARAEAERTSQLKDEFIATVSHELRSPLTAIIGWSRVLLEDAMDKAMVQRGLESIDRNARAQAQLIEDLLDVSRVATGRMRFQMEMLDFSQVVAEAVDGIRPAALAKKIELVLTLAAVRVRGDADRLQQVAFNILLNAVKFSRLNGRVEVIVETDGLHARMIVKDNGKGISPAFLPNIFQRFSQEDGSSTRRYGGMGLGLAIARHLVELHGGTIRAESDGDGKGATLTIELPLLRRGDSVQFNRLSFIEGKPPL